MLVCVEVWHYHGYYMLVCVAVWNLSCILYAGVCRGVAFIMGTMCWCV